MLQAAPTGFSAVVSPGGDVLQRTGVSEQRVLHDTVELRTGTTWSVRFADWPTLAVAVAAVAGGWLVARRRVALEPEAEPGAPVAAGPADH